LRIVLQDIGQAGRSQNLLPEVVRLESMGIGRVAGAVVVTFVERQKPRGLAPELGAHTHFTVVHRKVHHTAAKLEQLPARVAVAAVLLDSILYRLLWRRGT
jgi:hypothetical protein